MLPFQRRDVLGGRVWLRVAAVIPSASFAHNPRYPQSWILAGSDHHSGLPARFPSPGATATGGARSPLIINGAPPHHRRFFRFFGLTLMVTGSESAVPSAWLTPTTKVTLPDFGAFHGIW